MEIFTLLETLEEILENSRTVPFTDKIIVDKEQVLDIIKEIRLKLPDELKQAKWIKEERERIISEAQKDADDILSEAENRIIAMVDEHEITKKAYDKKTEIIADANKVYREITEGTNTYADGILAKLEENIAVVSQNITDAENAMKNALSEAETSMQNALDIIKNNRKELK